MAEEKPRVFLLRREVSRFGDQACEERISSLKGLDLAAERTNLLYPAD